MSATQEKNLMVNGEPITPEQEYANWLAFTRAMNLTKAQAGDYFPQVERVTSMPSTTTLGA